MKNLSALGRPLLVLMVATTMAGSSAADGGPSLDRTGRADMAYRAFSSVTFNASVKDVMDSSQRQTSTISLNRAALGEPHLLTISVPAGATLQGRIEIDGRTQQSLDGNSVSVDLSPLLRNPTTHVAIVGSYTPASSSVAITFTGPNTTIQQQAGGIGKIDYHLNLVVQ